MAEISVKEMVSYKGHSINANGTVNLTLNAQYSECTKSIMLLQMLNNDIKIVVKKVVGKAFKIGMFRIKEIKFDGDGESVIKLTSLSDFVDTDALNNLIPTSEEPKEFKVMFNADVEEEEGEEEDE